MSDPQLMLVIRAALRSTKAKRLDWTSYNQDTFRADIGPGTLRIARVLEDRRDEDGESGDGEQIESYSVWVMNKMAQIVMENAFGPSDPLDHDRQDYLTVRDLFLSARESGLRTRAVLGEMLTALESE